MPYIKEADRVELNPYCASASTPGELNYQVTTLVVRYLGEIPNYETYNAAIGALECAKLELYRRRLASYEDEKRAANGEVY